MQTQKEVGIHHPAMLVRLLHAGFDTYSKQNGTNWNILHESGPLKRFFDYGKQYLSGCAKATKGRDCRAMRLHKSSSNHG
jgi:hypothetical protein